MPQVIDCEYTIEGPGEGEGSGPPVIFIHGIGASRRAWDGVVPRIAADYRCIRYDLRGHGASPMSGLPFGLDDLVADLEALRARLGIEQAHFVGHSLGGMIGPAYAAAYPERVASLGLLSTAAGRTADDSAKVQGVLAAMEEKGIGPILETLTARWFTDDFMERHADIVQRRLDQVMSTDPDVFLNVFHIYAETETAPLLPGIEAPALVLTGELDGGCNPRLNRFIAAELPNATLVILAGYKHAILLEAADQVADHLHAFLAAQGASA